MLQVLIACAISAVPVAAQHEAPPDTLTPVVAPIPPEGPAPRGAFLRALVVPGWGHFYMGENRRGIIYASLQGTSWFMLGKTIGRLGDAREEERGIAALAIDSLATAMSQDTALARRLGEDPDAYERALETYPGLTGMRGLVTARERHRQDWIVYTLVLTFASAIDAYVTAHLADFPAEVTASRSADNGVSVGVRVPVGRGR
jgi:TM2 domain-containing membrane protein YozV